MYDVIVVGARCAGAPTAMLLARKGYRVLLLDRATFPSDTISTLIIWQTGVAKLKRWGLLDKVVKSGCPSITRFTMDLGDFPLSGWGPPADGAAESYAPRRTVLDKVLVDAAVTAGAELRDECSVRELVVEDGRVVGICGTTKEGATFTEQARIAVGADGKHSVVARAGKAPAYSQHASRSCFYYTFWEDLPCDGYEVYWPEGKRYILKIPTNGNQVLVVVVWPHDEFTAFRADVERNYMATLGLAPELADSIGSARRISRILGTGDVPNFFRKPYGPGWALVGDTGYNKDPITAFGISDAFRDAELLAQALDAGLSGLQQLDQALEGYEQKRNAVAMPLYEHTLSVANYQPHSPKSFEVRAALRGNQVDTDRFFGAIASTVPRNEFFNRENIQRIFRQAATWAKDTAERG
ncbi:MAG: FAD-dependent monooxygenase [SAR202 cluster bacterium]|nr:FAD-dependent monooxygenase [SAR202 cluster bacterium]